MPGADALKEKEGKRDLLSMEPFAG